VKAALAYLQQRADEADDNAAALMVPVKFYAGVPGGFELCFIHQSEARDIAAQGDQLGLPADCMLRQYNWDAMHEENGHVEDGWGYTSNLKTTLRSQCTCAIHGGK
jgi:hypothetical protein